MYFLPHRQLENRMPLVANVLPKHSVFGLYMRESACVHA